MDIKPTADYTNFENLDIRVGKIVDATEAETRKPTYRLRIDFGPEIGEKVSCGAYRNYQKAELVGKQIIAIINFGTKKMGPEKSEVLVLGVRNSAGETIYLTPSTNVSLGESVF